LASSAYDPWKRATDLVISAVLLGLTAPVQLVVAVMVRLRLGAPVIFRQSRPGLDERAFDLVKFRTMLEPDRSRGLVSDEERMTAFGAWLRSTSLDELPTLWNVLKGDMSLVGPRPLLVQYLDRYSPRQRRRHEVRPGVTGLAQVSGRNSVDWDRKFEYDLEYVDRRSLRLDFLILVATIAKVTKREGISDSASVTMAEFVGSGATHG
jgi:lipopolysaccharide/colanic/teichoic acid biosynthesis glycosyltransferase